MMGDIGMSENKFTENSRKNNRSSTSLEHGNNYLNDYIKYMYCFGYR